MSAPETLPTQTDPAGDAPAAAVADHTSATPPLASPVSSHRGRRRSRARIVVMILGGVGILAGGAVLIGIALANRPPAWWQPLDGTDPAIAEAALRVENGAATQLTKIRRDAEATSSDPAAAHHASKPWTIAIRSSDANAWLAARFRKWLLSQDEGSINWPKELGQIQLEFDSGMIHVGASVESATPAAGESGESRRPAQVLAASLRPELRPDGSLWMPAQRVSLGRLSLPASWMLSSGPSSSDSSAAAAIKMREVPENIRNLPQTKDLLQVLTGAKPAMAAPIIRIGDGRRVRLLGLESRNGVLLITCQTLPREASRAARTEP